MAATGINKEGMSLSCG